MRLSDPRWWENRTLEQRLENMRSQLYVDETDRVMRRHGLDRLVDEWKFSRWIDYHLEGWTGFKHTGEYEYMAVTPPPRIVAVIR